MKTRLNPRSIIDKFKDQHPLIINFSRESDFAESIHNRIRKNALSSFNHQKKYTHPSYEEINNYKTINYPNWIIQLKNYISELPELFEINSSILQVRFSLENSGNVFAENALVEFHAFGCNFFSREKNDKTKIITEAIAIPSPPKPPLPPKGKLESRYDSLIHTLTGQNELMKPYQMAPDRLIRNVPEEIDRNSFYYKTDKYGIPTDVIKLECQEFRHQIDPQEFCLDLIIPKINIPPTNLAIKFVFSCKNLPQPINNILKIKVEFTEKNSLQEVSDFLEKMEYLTP